MLESIIKSSIMDVAEVLAQYSTGRRPSSVEMVGKWPQSRLPMYAISVSWLFTNDWVHRLDEAVLFNNGAVVTKRFRAPT
jgi:hypothetical protein